MMHLERKIELFFFVVLTTILMGCSAKPIMVQQASTAGSKGSLPEWGKVFLLTPNLSFQEVKTEQVLPSERYDSESITEYLINYVKQMLFQKGFNVIQPDAVASGSRTELRDVLSSLNHQNKRMTKQWKDKSSILLSDMHTLRDYTGAEGVIINVIRVKVGARGAWNPMTGEITPGSSTSTMIACLTDIKSGKILWQNEIFVRRIPNLEDFHQWLDLLYSTFPDKRKEGVE